jgi:hypothetical protein
MSFSGTDLGEEIFPSGTDLEKGIFSSCTTFDPSLSTLSKQTTREDLSI